ncbi:MAG: hypothetical protein ABSE82_08435 [Nitrososphaerales archaeon]|jgi:hypothetical protein
MATILVKGLPDGTLKQLKKLKVELDCKTWAELFEKLAESEGQRKPLVFQKEDLQEMKRGVKGFLALRGEVSKNWTGPPTVLAEIRKSRRHE